MNTVVLYSEKQWPALETLRLRRWCKTNLNEEDPAMIHDIPFGTDDRHYDYRYLCIYFKHAEDATLFALKWGGERK